MLSKLREYAKLVVEVGLNVQKGQTLLISAPVQSVEFVRLCAEAAYDVGCREVIVDFADDELTRMRYLRADAEVFDTVRLWDADKLNTLAREGMARLAISAADPDALKGVDQDRIRRSAQARGEALAEYRELSMSSAICWCVVSIPTPAWARKMFPDKSEAEAMDALWNAIFTAVRVTGDGKAVERWREHTDTVQARADRLNGFDFASLRFTNSLGTDLLVELPEGHIWSGGAEECSRTGVRFVANMPTEEIFTAPKRDGVHGRVVSSLPFSLHGNVIDRFSFTLKDGKIVSVETEKEEDRKLLETAISLDEGASRFGEVALVPHESPISNMKTLFYNTLFDENAACHFAFGEAYATCIQGGGGMDKDTLRAKGMNTSITHEDFMIGTSDLSIVGTTKDGREIPVFVGGNFAF